MRFARCIDNTLQQDVLTVGRVYEVQSVDERDGYVYLAGGLGRFSRARFQEVENADARA